MQSATAMMWSMRFSARRDLRVQAQENCKPADRKPAAYFNVLDPITRQSYRVGELERSLLGALDGTRTLAQVLKLLRRERQFESVSDHQLLLTIEQLQRNGLIRSRQVTTSSPSRGRSVHPMQVQSWLAGFVSWQLRGLQPDAWLGKLVPYTNAIFSGRAVVFWLSLAAVSCLGVLLEFPRLAAQSSAWQWIVHPVQGGALFAVFLITRALHELGHAVVCKRHGVRCPDIGLFVVLGAPCVYCDVSESWQLPNRWQRAAVAAAGMYVELIVATLASWIWMLTIDGPANTVALQTMFVCSVSTVLINANPLMRFDGYYILSDLLDEANLRGRADSIAESQLYRWILGRSAGTSKEAGGACERFLCLFSWLGWGYRAGLSLAIAGLLVSIYDSWKIAWIGRTIAVLILISWWGIPGIKFAKNLIQMAEKTQKLWRLTIVAGVFVALVALMPVPYRQFASGWAQPESMRGVFAPVTGTLQYSDEKELPNSGESVDKDELLFCIYDAEAVHEVIRANENCERARIDFTSHQLDQSQDIEPYRAAFESAERRLKEANETLEKCRLKSPSAGQFISTAATPATGPTNLAVDSLQYHWTSPTQNGRLIPKGTLMGTICGSQKVAVIPLSDSQLEWVDSGTEVRVRCAERAAEVYTCKVDKVVALEDVNAVWLLMNRDLTDASSVSSSWSGPKPGAASSAALVSLPPNVECCVGARIDGVFIAPSQTLTSIAYRWLKQNLRWLAD